jgi:hypothetical protein
VPYDLQVRSAAISSHRCSLSSRQVLSLRPSLEIAGQSPSVNTHTTRGQFQFEFIRGQFPVFGHQGLQSLALARMVVNAKLALALGQM